MTGQVRATRFPAAREGFAAALADEPVLLDGLRVVFDEKVTLVPVTLEPERNAEEADGLAR